MSKNLADIQYTRPDYEIRVNRVGINAVQLPIFIAQKDGGVQHSVAKVECFVDLAADLKGTNMSRLIIGLQKFIGHQLSGSLICSIAENIRLAAEADVCELSYDFPYFLRKMAPVSQEPGLLPYHVRFTGIKRANEYVFRLKTKVLATSLCPCSKEISDYGAHNQKVLIAISAQMKSDSFLWVEDLIDISEQSASCEVYSVLKRVDEKAVTEAAYNNPKFVEDIARHVYAKVVELESIGSFRICVESDESIHAHNAVSIITNY